VNTAPADSFVPPPGRVAFLGLGRMGSAMARNLVRGHAGTVLWNRTATKAEELAAELGASAAATPAEAARGAVAVVTMLADDAAVEQTLTGPDGVLTRLEPGALVIDMSTTAPDSGRALAERVAAAGGHFLDAPVSGSTATAEAAQLTIMVGGDPDPVKRARPLLSTMGANVLYLGPVGSGATAKLAVNAIVYGLCEAVAEALVLAERAGIERRAVYEVFTKSAIAAPFVHYRRDAFMRPGESPVAFRMELAAKDLRLIESLAAEYGAPIPQASLNLEVIEAAIESGYGEDDMAAVAEHLRSWADGVVAHDAQGRG
jgi:3-hydroxyisobutyrate dehydrogenase-like beta-hydroxyacid dehydrogenase